jgi:sulfate permease, SulP family
MKQSDQKYVAHFLSSLLGSYPASSVVTSCPASEADVCKAPQPASLLCADTGLPQQPGCITGKGKMTYSVLPNWMTSYRKEWLRPDLVAGVTTAAVIIPKAMAYATIAGLPVQVGLYTAFLPMVIYAVVGTSRVLSVSTTTTIAILAAADLGAVVPDGNPASLIEASAALTLIVGAMLVLASILRLGFVANFISEPVLIGFKAGIGLVIVFDQLPKIFGIHIARSGFFRTQISLVRHLPDTSLITLAVGVAMIALLIGIEHFAPKLPAPLFAVGLSIAAAYLLNLHARGVELVGHIPRGLPHLTLPDVSLAAQLWPGALGIALMSFTETVAAGRAFARSDEPTPRANRELLATGLANAGGALLGAMPGGGGTTQTAVNRLAGAHTQMSELATAAITLVVMLLLAPMIALMPQATLAAVVIVYSFGLIKPAEFRTILSIRRTEFIWALVAFTGVVLVGTLKGIVVAIIVSLLALAYQVADPPVYILGRKPGTSVFRPRSKENPEDEEFPGLLILRTEGRIFFANAAQITHKTKPLVELHKPRILVLDMSGVPDLEYTALKMLIDAEKRNRELGIRLWLVGMNPQVLAVVRRSQLGNILGREGMHFNLEMAVAQYQASVNESGR